MGFTRMDSPGQIDLEGHWLQIHLRRLTLCFKSLAIFQSIGPHISAFHHHLRASSLSHFARLECHHAHFHQNTSQKFHKLHDTQWVNQRANHKQMPSQESSNHLRTIQQPRTTGDPGHSHSFRAQSSLSSSQQALPALSKLAAWRSREFLNHK